MTTKTPTATSSSTDGVYFIDKNYRRIGFLSRIEQVSHPAGSHSYQHLHKLRSSHRKERHSGFTGHCPSQQCFSYSGLTGQENSLGSSGSKVDVFLGIFQKINHFFQLFFGFVHSGYIRELDVLFSLSKEFGLTFSDTKHVRSPSLSFHHIKH